MIIDFDNHYKKGIEDAWNDADRIGKGKGYNVVIPLPAGSRDVAYPKAFLQIIFPVAGQCKPELVVLIAGYASNIFDPLCRQQISAEGYNTLVKIVRDIADKYAKGRLIAILEGGKRNYMSFCILKSIEAMRGEDTAVQDPVAGLLVGNKLAPDQEKAIKEVKRIPSPYWKFQDN